MSNGPDSLHAFAARYTAAWCSQNPASVADHYSLSGSLCINGAAPAVGRSAITEAAKSFMDAFPDLQVIFDRLAPKDNSTEYHWTLLGTNTGPGGTGRRVRISGFEVWKIDADGLIEESRGYFDAAHYQSQLERGPDL